MAKLQKNDRYRIDDLALIIYGYLTGQEYEPLIGITDLTEDREYTLDSLRSTTMAQHEELELKKQEKVAARDLSLSSFKAIREYVKEWKVQKTGDNMYGISGPGLGWSDEKLTNGQWVFKLDKGQMTPVDRDSVALLNFWTARL